MKTEITTRILEHYSGISAKQKHVADFILENPDKIPTMTMKELAASCDVAEPTIVRFLNKLNYDSFLAFRVDLARETNVPEVSTLGDGYKAIYTSDSTSSIIRKASDAISTCLKMTEVSLDHTRIDEVSAALLKADSIVFYGAGNSSSIAMDAGYRFFRMGLDSFYSENLHLVLTKLSHMNENDVLILISHSGESSDMLACARAAKEQGITIVGITGNYNSPLSKLADYLLFTSSMDQEVYSDAMVSRIAQMMIIDVLYIKLRLALGDSASDSIQHAHNLIVKVKHK